MGQIQEFSKPEVTIGRDPTCDVRFPSECATISRKHAKLIREWNQFRLIDMSANGTFVNGKKTDQVHMKDGDVLTIAPNGPKISFLTKIDDSVAADIAVSVEAEHKEPVGSPASPAKNEPARSEAKIPPPQSPTVLPAKVSLVVQYGPRLESFNQLPIDLGSAPPCAFVISQPEIREQHAQLFYAEDSY